MGADSKFGIHFLMTHQILVLQRKAFLGIQTTVECWYFSFCFLVKNYLIIQSTQSLFIYYEWSKKQVEQINRGLLALIVELIKLLYVFWTRLSFKKRGWITTRQHPAGDAIIHSFQNPWYLVFIAWILFILVVIYGIKVFQKALVWMKKNASLEIYASPSPRKLKQVCNSC